MEIEKTDILLTIAIPTYNRRNLLKRALESIIPQLNPKIEVLVSDNASDDGTDEMMGKYYPKIRYIKNKTNMGFDYNFLQCYREARGKYIILFGSDDRLAEGALAYLTNFLEKNDCDWLFVNYRYYDVTKREVYIKNSERIKDYVQKQDILTNDRNLFMKFANHGVTYMSANIVKRQLMSEVSNPDRFIGTYFIHTYIMLEAVKNKQALFGIVMQPFVENNATAGENEIGKTLDIYFTVFGKSMYHALCVHAEQCGFQKKRMKKVYLQYLYDFPFWKLLLSAKRKNNSAALENFRRDGYPVVKHFPSELIKVMIVTITPRCVIDMIYNIHDAIKKHK